MFSSSSKLLGATLAVAALFNSVYAQGCGAGPFALVHPIGETKPDPNKMVEFCATKWSEGVPINGLDVWYNDEGISAVAVSYVNGDKSSPYGVPGTSNHASIDWDYSQAFVDDLSLWGNGGGSQLGQIRLSLTDGRKLDVGNLDPKRGRGGKAEYVIDVASGVMLGFGGWGNDVIRQGYFTFLKSQIDRIEMTNPVFDESPENLNKQQRGLKTVTLDYADHFNNNKDSNETYTFTKQMQKTETTSTSSSVNHTFGAKFSMSVTGRFLVVTAKSSLELSYQFQEQKTQSTTKTTQNQVSWSIETMLKPQQHVYCRATAMFGQADLGFTSTILVQLKDGSNWSWQEKGQYSQVAWSQASSVCQDRDFTDAEKQVASVGKRALKFIG